MFTQNLKTKHHLKIFLVFKETNYLLFKNTLKSPRMSTGFHQRRQQIISFYDSNRANILVSLGKKSEMNPEKLHRIIKNLKKQRESFKDKKVLYFLEEQDTNFLEDQIQAIAQTHHDLDYKTKSESKSKTKKNSPQTTKKSQKKQKTPQFQFFLRTKKINTQDQKILKDSIQLLRNLGDEPANILTPTEYIKRIKEVCKEC